jgi:DNA-binding NarL/FixJ family response regulator
MNTPSLSRSRTLFLADTQTPFLEGLQALFESEPNLKVVGMAQQSDMLESQLTLHQPQLLVLTDALVGNHTYALIQRLAGRFPHLRLLVLVEEPNLFATQTLVQAGAHGVLEADAHRSEFLAAARALFRGEYYFGVAVQQSLYTLLRNGPARAVPQPQGQQQSDGRLTEREVGILHLLAEGCTSGEIAERLRLSPRTVDTHRKNMLRKTGVPNAAGLIQYGVRHGLL